MEPLFKIFFRDAIVARKYRTKLENLIKYMLVLEDTENSRDFNPLNLVLQVFETNQNLFSTTNFSNHNANCEDVIILEEILNNDINAQNVIEKFSNNNVDIPKSKKEKKRKHKRPLVDPKIEQESPQVKRKRPFADHNIREQSPLIKRRRLHSLVDDESDDEYFPINKLLSESEEKESKIKVYKNIFERKYSKNDLEINFENSDISIGSFRYFNQSKSVFLSNDGLTFFVPTLKKDKQMKILNIDLNEITKVSVHFSETNLMLFFLISGRAAERVRALLDMDDSNGPYFDPNHADPKYKYLIISSAEMNDSFYDSINELFESEIIHELNETEADRLYAPILAIKELNNKENDNFINPDSHKNVKTLYSRAVRVGTYEYSKRRVFSISEDELKFYVPPLYSTSAYSTITVEMNEIVKISIRFSKTLPVLFFYISNDAIDIIRKIIGMNGQSEQYFTYIGNSHHNKIIIFPQEISEDCCIIQKLMEQGKIQKLDDDDANDILANSILDSQTMTKYLNTYLELKVSDSIIGYYRHEQWQKNFIISYQGIKLNIPFNGGLTIAIDFSEIVGVMFHASKALGVLMFFTTVSCADRIGSIFRLHNTNNNQYFDFSYQENLKQNRITIILDSNSNRRRETLKRILNEMPFAEHMSLDEAQLVVEQTQTVNFT